MQGTGSLFALTAAEETRLKDQVRNAVLAILHSGRMPSAAELVSELEHAHGTKARTVVPDVVEELAESRNLTRTHREYFGKMLSSGALVRALSEGAPSLEETRSSLDELIARSRAYRQSKPFQELVSFMGRFKKYAPYNNMLVRIQNPGCTFYATQKTWAKEHGKRLKEDARPMLILAPKHPVLLVYDIDQVEGGVTPEELRRFATFEGPPSTGALDALMQKAQTKDDIRIDRKDLSSTLAGFATIDLRRSPWGMRVVLHTGLNENSTLGVLCHELAHIYCGHLGCPDGSHWPDRRALGHAAMEIEAESVAYLVTTRLGLEGSSHAYVSRYLENGEVPEQVSLDTIAKVAGRIESMARPKKSTTGT